MRRRWRLLVVPIILVFAAAWYGPRVGAQEHARHRDRDRGRTHTERRREATPPEAQRSQERRQERADQGDDARRRHPRPSGRYDSDKNRSRNHDYRRYHWRNWDYRQRWDRDRFPRSYFGPRIFGECSYRGRAFGPHGRLWYLFRHTSWQMFYWPYPYAPRYGCEWYWVPAERWPAYDEDGYEYWEYSDYRYIRLCFN